MCIKPITLKSCGTKWSSARYIQVPCGKCIECKIQYQNSWFIRLYEESKNHKHIIFFTLTYRETCVPYYVNKYDGQIYRTVYAKHVQDWLKRFRIRFNREFGKDAKFKYFITSEYGPRTYRPHLHGIIFGIDKITSASLFNDWRKKFGFVKVSHINPLDDKRKQNCIRYLAKYCSKGEYECPYVEQGKVNKTFHLISKKLGYAYIPRNINYHLTASARRFLPGLRYNPDYLHEVNQKRIYTLNGFRYSLPRYYKNKIYGEQSRLSYALTDHLLSELNDIRERQLAQIQSERNCTHIEADNILTNIENELHAQRYKKAKQNYERFLNKSKL